MITGCFEGRFQDSRNDRSGSDVAILSNGSTCADHGVHVDHGAFPNDRPDVDDSPHHDDGLFADGHKLPDVRSGFNAGFQVRHIQEGNGTVAPIAFKHHVRYPGLIGLKKGIDG
jgi:hypothetical protein